MEQSQYTDAYLKRLRDERHDAILNPTHDDLPKKKFRPNGMRVPTRVENADDMGFAPEEKAELERWQAHEAQQAKGPHGGRGK